MKCWFHFTGKNLCNWGVFSIEDVAIKHAQDDITKILPIKYMDHSNTSFVKFYEKYDHEPLILENVNNSHTGDQEKLG